MTAALPETTRRDGWPPDRQVRFLTAIADGQLVHQACAMVGLSVTAAYSFRRRANGAAFALGWAAANLHARERLADTLLERALTGQVETITRPDGTAVQRHRLDNRLGQAMLARLDRLAAADPQGLPAAPDAPHPAADPAQAARTVAAGFDAYLDLIAADAGPARAQLFVACAVGTATACTPALALADRWLHAAPIDTTTATSATSHPDAAAGDAPATPPVQTATSATSPAAPVRDHAMLDPADRAHWTATDWARAEAAGLLHLAPAPPASAPPAGDADDEDSDDDAPAPAVWRESRDVWRTSFPPPPDFTGEEEYEYGDPDYNRTLSWDEQEIAERYEAADPARLAHAAERDAWFAGGGAPVADPGDDAGRAAPSCDHDGPAADTPEPEPDTNDDGEPSLPEPEPDPVPPVAILPTMTQPAPPPRTPSRNPAEAPLTPSAREALVRSIRVYQALYDTLDAELPSETMKSAHPSRLSVVPAPSP